MNSLIKRLKRLFAALTDLVLPQRCASCRAPGAPLCARCARPLAAPPTRLPAPPGSPPLWCLGPHEGPLRRLLIAHKERGRTTLTRPLAAAYAHLATTALFHRPPGEPWQGVAEPSRSPGEPSRPPGEVCLVPVPSTRAAVRRRGRDAMLALARATAAELRARGVPARAAPALSRRRGTADQGGLGRAARRRNLHHALRASPTPPDARVLVLDDVTTTGATLRESVRALTTTGTRVEALLVLTTAHDPTLPTAPGTTRGGRAEIRTKGKGGLWGGQESRKLTWR
ncbi:ComF family protein [Actinocorallia sp. API 0066]|uniref:ComF family protein n=1 Tax=Actinocorallia sp. API 0066 TaxID=2896846 RepID=UPI001E5A8A76|nr:ComF family protein [Actinocorallia sp. API 0066]MCD0451211.1 ComF family protein [Actinocorallia sp. API 0066]